MKFIYDLCPCCGAGSSVSRTDIAVGKIREQEMVCASCLAWSVSEMDRIVGRSLLLAGIMRKRSPLKTHCWHAMTPHPWNDKRYCFCPECGAIRLAISPKEYRYQPPDAFVDMFVGKKVPTFQKELPTCAEVP